MVPAPVFNVFDSRAADAPGAPPPLARRFSPDHETAPVAETQSYDGDLYQMETDGTGLRRLPQGGDYHYPDWAQSGGGDPIIFDGFGSGIQIVPMLRGVVSLVNHDVFADRPDWSPDGGQMAFHKPGGLGEILIMNADGSNVRTLAAGFAPDRSPDGTKILFHSEADGDWDIYVINVNGTGLTNLTAGRPGSDESPDWSRTGSNIVFSFREENGENWELGIMDAKGGPVTNFTSSRVDERYPQW